ncbi:MAG: TrkH family potassium uptake protein [Bacteroidales bacterium]|nr:TrkH family potassium uptake protein [Bacteroidales bacterium]
MLLYLAVALLLPVTMSAVVRDGALTALLLSEAATTLAGLLMTGTFRLLASKSRPHRGGTAKRHNALWITATVWTLVPLFGALPFLLSGTLASPVDALFESVSGFTTTGASLIVQPQTIAPSLLLWRSMTQWIGGLGLVLFVIAILRRIGVASLELYEAEFSGTLGRKLHPHIAVSVSRMWRIYLLLTLLLAAALLLCGEGPLRSLCIALSTVSTGGFMPTEGGLTGLRPATSTVLTVMMFLSGVNIALLFHLVCGRPRPLLRSREFHLYIAIYLVATAMVALSLTAAGNSLRHSLSYSLFHIASTISTCGFYLPSPSHWSLWASGVTFLLLFLGPMAGSTGGGIKLKRIMILGHSVRNYFTHILHPSATLPLSVDGDRVEPDYVSKVYAFVFLYIMLTVAGAFILTLCGLDLQNAFAMAAANISNLGASPLLTNLGASIDYPALPLVGKCTLMILMTAGRLEIFALLAIFFPAYWKK